MFRNTWFGKTETKMKASENQFQLAEGEIGRDLSAP